ncbi:MAG: DUF4831 family protein [Bacteroidales bacterium]|nr:DUF4831 family protein [Bacteroidales bacterium]
MKKLIIIALTILIIAGCRSNYNVIKINSVNENNCPKKGGIFYALPKNIIIVDVLIREKIKTKGIYSDFSEYYFGIKDFNKENNKSYEIYDIKISSVSEKDTNQLYYVNFNKCNKKTKNSLISLSEEGIIQSLNEEEENNNRNKNIESNRDLIYISERSKSLGYLKNLKVIIDTFIQKVKIDSSIVEKKIIKSSFIEKTIEQKAKECYELIIKLKDNRLNLITGFSEVPYTKETMDFMKCQIDKAEKELMIMFTGDTTSNIVKHSFTFTPSRFNVNKDIALFNFSSKKGIISNSEIDAIPVFINVKPVNESKAYNKFETFSHKKNPDKKGFYYRIPENSRVIIKTNNSIISENYLLISQLGITSQLPATVSKISFYPNTGSIKKIEQFQK